MTEIALDQKNDKESVDLSNTKVGHLYKIII